MGCPQDTPLGSVLFTQNTVPQRALQPAQKESVLILFNSHGQGGTGRAVGGSKRRPARAPPPPPPLPSPPAQEDPLLSHWPPRPSRPPGPALLQVHPRSLSDSQQSPFQATLIPPAWMKSFLLSQRTTRGPKGAAGAECQRTGCTLSPRNVSSCGKLCKKWSSSAKSWYTKINPEC